MTTQVGERRTPMRTNMTLSDGTRVTVNTFCAPQPCWGFIGDGSTVKVVDTKALEAGTIVLDSESAADFLAAAAEGIFAGTYGGVTVETRGGVTTMTDGATTLAYYPFENAALTAGLVEVRGQGQTFDDIVANFGAELVEFTEQVPAAVTTA